MTCNNSSLLSQFIHNIGTTFAIKNLGSIHYFLGIEVHQMDGALFLSQEQYSLKLLKRANLLHEKIVATPIITKH